MNKIEKTIFSIIFAVAALFVVFVVICWSKVSIIVGIDLGLIFLIWGGYAFLNAWFELDEKCRKKHEKQNQLKR